MKHVIVYAHPNTESFNHAILETVKSELEGKGHEVRVRDLYELNFNPVLGASDFISFSQEIHQKILKKNKNISLGLTALHSFIQCGGRDFLLF